MKRFFLCVAVTAFMVQLAMVVKPEAQCFAA